MKKYSKTIVIIIAVILLAVFYIINNSYVYLYTNPNTNTQIFPYIAKTTKELNRIIYTASKQVNLNNYNTKVSYTEAYGSGFLKNNITPSDLDYSAGLYIGKFIYDGTNTSQIAYDIIKITTLFEANVVNIIKTTPTPFYSDIDTSLLKVFNLDNKNMILTETLSKAMTGNPYEINIKNKIMEMSPYQALLPDYKYIKLFSKNIKYNKNYPDILREITLCISYYADIIDKTTRETKRIHISTETPDEHRLQKETRLFTPSAYTNLNSFNAARYFLKIANEDNLQLENFFAHFKNGVTIDNETTNPLKVVTGILQCADILEPILPKQIVNEIRKNSSEILTNQTLAYLNDYLVAGKILQTTANSEKLLNSLENTNEISNQISSMEKLLANMINDSALKYEELKPLFEYQKKLNDAKNNIALIQEITQDNSIDNYIYKIMLDNMPQRTKFGIYSKYYTEVMEVAGINKAHLLKDKPGHVYILKDKNTIKLKNINEIKMQNGHNSRIYDKNTKFTYADKNNFSINESEIYWYRDNPTQLQNSVLEDIKSHFVKGKKHHHIRINAGLIK